MTESNSKPTIYLMKRSRCFIDKRSERLGAICMYTIFAIAANTVGLPVISAASIVLATPRVIVLLKNWSGGIKASKDLGKRLQQYRNEKGKLPFNLDERLCELGKSMNLAAFNHGGNAACWWAGAAMIASSEWYGMAVMPLLWLTLTLAQITANKKDRCTGAARESFVGVETAIRLLPSACARPNSPAKQGGVLTP